MKPWQKWTIGFFIVSGYSACSPKEFSADGCQGATSGCVTQNDRAYFNYVEKVDFGKVDILIVNDNSASMSFEQNQLASRFDGFIQNLENKGVNYRIGVVTTDISSASNPARAINENGALQDGRLIAFPSGAKFLTKEDGSLSQKDTAFKSVVKRGETATCEQYIIAQLSSCGGSQSCKDARRADPAYQVGYTANCPSGDERGIYAANMVVSSNPDSFLRPEADLAIIVLADEDERSANYRTPVAGSTTARSEQHGYNASFALEDRDRAQAFKDLMISRYPHKKYAVHPIIVQNNDQACLEQQNNQTLGVVNGSYGLEYEWLRYHSGGTQGSICAPDYAVLLQNIFNNVTQNMVSKIGLRCSNPADLTVSNAPVQWNVIGSEIRFASNLPAGTSVTVSYSCPAY